MVSILDFVRNKKILVDIMLVFILVLMLVEKKIPVDFMLDSISVLMLVEKKNSSRHHDSLSEKKNSSRHHVGFVRMVSMLASLEKNFMLVEKKILTDFMLDLFWF
jgi:hypothetical protein